MKRLVFSLFLLGSLFISSCKKDTDTTPVVQKENYYAVLVTTDLSTSSGLLFASKDAPSGTIDITKVAGAKQIANVRNGGIFFGGGIFMGTNTAGDAGVQKFTIDATGQIIDAGYIAAGVADYNTKFHIVKSDLGFYSEGAAGELKIQVFNPATMKRTGEIDLSTVSKKSANKEIVVETVGQRMITAKEGKLYVDIVYAKSDFGFGNSAYDAVFVAVIDINTLKYEKTITFESAQEISYPPVNLFMSEVDEKGDLYINTMGNMLSPDRNSKILRIKKGESDFDKTFQIDINNFVTGVGVKWFHGGGVAINGKVVTGIKQTPFAPDYSNFNEENIVFHTIDVNTKLATPLTGLPKTDFVSICTPFYMDSKVLIPYSNSVGSGVYSYDGTTAKEMFKVSSGVVSGVFKVSK